MNKNTATIGIAALVGIVIGILVTMSFSGDRNTRNTSGTTNNNPASEGTENGTSSNATGTESGVASNGAVSGAGVVSGIKSLVVTDQKAGNTVRVESVDVASPTWIAIADDVNGAPGRILGARLFERGMGINEVVLQRSTVAGKTYHVVFYADSNNNRSFDVKSDARLSSPAGTVSQTVFRAQ